MLKNSAMRLLAMLLITGISVVLGGCLVKKKDPSEIETFSRTTNLWHVYQADEWIEYNLQAVNPATAVTTQGILRMQWEASADITDPIDPLVTYPVLKETTTITYDDNISGDPDVIVIRYISQINTTPTPDPNQGRIILHAIDDGTGIKYWPYADPNNPPDTPVIAPILFDSPMTVGVPPVNTGQSFSIMQCDSGLCDTEIYRYRDETLNVVSDATYIDTSLGRFSNPFQINFDGYSLEQNAQALTFVGDIRDACGTISDNITHGTSSGRGSLFVFPEIGIIEMRNACTVVGGETVFYSATLRDTNITF